MKNTTKPYNFWIAKGALTITLNALDNPDYVQAAVAGGAVILIYVPGVIEYDAAHNYRKWKLKAYPTVLMSPEKMYVYARISRDFNKDEALIVYSSKELDLFGKNIEEKPKPESKAEAVAEEQPEQPDNNDKVEPCYLVYLGRMSDSKTAGFRHWDEYLVDSGELATDQQIREESSAAIFEYFGFDGATRQLYAKYPFSSFFTKILKIGQKAKEILDIKRFVDSDTDVPIADTNVPTSKWVDEHALSSDHDDTASGKIGFKKGLSIGVPGKYVADIKRSSDSDADVPVADTNVPTSKWVDEHALSSDHDDTAHGKITFEQGADFGQFNPGLFGSGANIDKDGHGEMRSLRLWEFLEVPELRYNRVSVNVGIQMNTVGGGIIESVDPDASGLEQGLATLKLEDGEFGAIDAGDLIMGIWHDEGSTENSEVNEDDHKGNFSFKGFKTIYFQVVSIEGDRNERFNYILRSKADGGNGFHPFPGMHFATRGNVDETKKNRQSFTYNTTEYAVALTGVNSWVFTSDNYYEIRGKLDGFSMKCKNSDGEIYIKHFSGYGQVFGNAYLFGKIDDFERQVYKCVVESSHGEYLDENETSLIKVFVMDKVNLNVTHLFPILTVTRNTGQPELDTAWNEAHSEMTNPFYLDYDDLGIDGTGSIKIATFSITASAVISEETITVSSQFVVRPAPRDGKDGQDAIIFDADDEMIPVAVDKDGKAIAGQEWYINFYCHIGATSHSAAIDSIGLSPAINHGWFSGGVSQTRFYPIEDYIWKEGKSILKTVNLSYGGHSGSCATKFYPVFPGPDGESPVLYQLELDKPALRFRRDENGNYIDSYDISSSFVKVLRKIGKNVSEVTFGVGDPIYVYSSTDGTNFTRVYSGDSESRLIVTGIFAETHKGLTYELWEGSREKSSSHKLDKEFVPFVLDGPKGDKGDKGDGSVIFDSDNEMIPVAVDAKGEPIAGQEWPVNFYCHIGATSKRASVVSVNYSEAIVVASPTPADPVTKFSPRNTYVWTKGERVLQNVSLSCSGHTAEHTTKFYPVFPGPDGESPVLYQLRPDKNSLRFRRNEKGEYIDSYSISSDFVKVIRQKGTALSVVSFGKEDSICVYRSTDGTNFDRTYSGDFSSMLAVMGAYAEEHKGITYELWDGDRTLSTSTMLDKEFVPFVLDGPKGDHGDKGDKGDPGTSPLMIDADDDMIPVALDANGICLGGNKEVHFSAFYGSKEVTTEVVFKSEEERGDLVSAYWANNNTYYFTLLEGKSWKGVDKVKFTAVVDNSTYGRASVVVSFVPIYPGPDGKSPEIYQVKPTPNVLVYGKDEYNDWTGSHVLRANIVKVVGGEETEVTDQAETLGLTLTAAFDGYEGGQPLSPKVGLTISADFARGSRFIGVELRHNGVMADQESVGIVCDGDKGDKGDHGDKGDKGDRGDSAFIADSDDDLIPVPVINAGKAYGFSDKIIHIRAYYGSTEITEGLTYSSPDLDPSKVEIYGNGPEFSIEVFPNSDWSDQKKVQANFLVHHAVYGTAVARVNLVPTFPGADSKIYSLQTSYSAFPFGRNADGTLIGDFGLKVNIIEHNGAQQIVHETEPSTLWSYGGFDSSKNLDPLTAAMPVQKINAENAVGHHCYIVELWEGNKTQSGSKMLDRESIPIIVDGANGVDGQFTSAAAYSASQCQDRAARADVVSWSDTEIVEDKGNVWVAGNHINLIIPCVDGNKYVCYQKVVDRTLLLPLSYYISEKGDKGDQGLQGEHGEDGLGFKPIVFRYELEFTYDEWIAMGAPNHLEYFDAFESDNPGFKPGDTLYVKGKVSDRFKANGDNMTAAIYGTFNYWDSGDSCYIDVTMMLMDGERGEDGDNYEYIFCLNTIEEEPYFKPAATESDDFQKDDYYPAEQGWTDDATGISESYPFEYVRARRKVKGKWQDFGKATIWAKYGKDGADGNSITDVINYYKSLPDGTTIPEKGGTANGWSTTPTSLNETDKYLWNYEEVVNSKKANTETTPSVIGVWSKDGKEISSIEEEYGASPSQKIVPTVWGPDEPVLNDSDRKYLWNRETVHYSDGTYTELNPHTVCVYGDKGDKGDNGSDGKDQHVNLLDRTSLRGDVLKVWNVFDPSNVIGNGDGKFGTNSVYANNNKSRGVLDVIQQQIKGGYFDKIAVNQWYTLSFWAKGTSVTTYIYGGDGAVDVNAGCIKDGIAETIPSDGHIYWSVQSQEWKHCVLTFKTKSVISSVIHLLFRLGDSSDIYLSAMKLENGKDATDWNYSSFDLKGAELHTSEWEVGQYYQAGKVDEDIHNVVYFREEENGPRKAAMCIQSHVSSLENKPGTTGGESYWDLSHNLKFIASDLALVRLIKAEEIDVDKLTARRITTKPIDKGPVIDIQDGMMRIFGPNDENGNPRVMPGIEVGMVGNCPVLRFYDENGKLTGDLGPGGWMPATSAQFVDIKLSLISQYSNPTWNEISGDVYNPVPEVRYKYQASDGSLSVNSGKIYRTNDFDAHGEPAGSVVGYGWYLTSFGSPQMVYIPSIPSGSTDIVGPGVLTGSQVCLRTIFEISNGKFTGRLRNVYYLDYTQRTMMLNL